MSEFFDLMFSSIYKTHTNLLQWLCLARLTYPQPLLRVHNQCHTKLKYENIYEAFSETILHLYQVALTDLNGSSGGPVRVNFCCSSVNTRGNLNHNLLIAYSIINSIFKLFFLGNSKDNLLFIQYHNKIFNYIIPGSSISSKLFFPEIEWEGNLINYYFRRKLNFRLNILISFILLSGPLPVNVQYGTKIHLTLSLKGWLGSMDAVALAGRQQTRKTTSCFLIDSHSVLISFRTLRSMLTSARTRDGRFSPMFGFATWEMIMWLDQWPQQMSISSCHKWKN